MTATLYDKLISGANILIKEADKANKRGDAERRAFMLNDCVEFLTNGLKKQGDLRKVKPTRKEVTREKVSKMSQDDDGG